MKQKTQRTYVYIDGFNLYYGALKNTPYKWLNLKLLFHHLLNDSHEIIAIKYYTARVKARDNDPQITIRQSSYLRALQKYIPELSIHYGHYLTHEVKLPLVKPMGRKKFVTVLKSEEKGSDVNMAIHILNDAWLDCYDCAIIVSNDSDLSESLKLIKKQGKKIGLITPAGSTGRRPTQSLREHSDFIKTIRTGILKVSQLPDVIPDSNIHKPTTW